MKLIETKPGILNTTILLYDCGNNIIFKTTKEHTSTGIVKNTLTNKKEIKTSRDKLKDIIEKVI